MASKSFVNVDIKKLRQLYEGLKKRPDIQVGVFSGKGSRKGDSGLTNAELASYHEYGAPEHGLPARSVLRTPLADHAQQIMAEVKGKEVEFLKEGGSMKLWKLIGIAAEKVIIQAFDTGGFGKWAPLTYKTLMSKVKGSLKKRKGKLAQIYAGTVGMGILIRTGQLRRAYSSRVRMKL